MMPKSLKRLLRPLIRRGGSSAARKAIPQYLPDEQSRRLVARMDAGDYSFDADTVARMCAAWRADPASVPYPTALTRAYSSGDAVAMNDKSLMQISYRLPYSHAYEETQAEKYGDFIDAIAKAGIIFDNARVADIGCGYGGLLEVLRKKYLSTRLSGIECAPSAIEYMAEHRAYIQGVLADVEAPSGAFVGAVGTEHDIVLCTEVLEHLVQPERALANLMALRPRRGLAITVPNGRIDTAAQHINFWSPESWSQFIRKHASGDWQVAIGRCHSPGSPGGFDNLAILIPKA
jgi:hypothetical protein